MTQRPRKKAAPLSVAVVLFVCGTAAGYLLAVLPVRNRVGGLNGDFLRTLGIGSLTWYACLLSSPLYLWLARRYPINGPRSLRNLAIHGMVTESLVLLTGLIYYQLMRWLSPGARIPALAPFLALRLATESLPFWAMIAVIHAFEFRRRQRADEMRAAQLQASLAEARLEALTAQLQPHFLFNTMQGISTLMHRDLRAADAMLARLSDLLRETLRRGERREAMLQEEMAMLGHYIAISQERFRDRLNFETDVAPDAASAMVPFFILQPLVENALQHGIARRSGAGVVRVEARRNGDFLELRVRDDGPGLDKTALRDEREGIGLSNTRQRLQELYGARQSLTLCNNPEGGLMVEVMLPFRTSDAAAKASAS